MGFIRSVIASACMSFVAVAAAVAPTGKSGKQSIQKITVDSVDFRSDLTRVYCRIFGRPHTSGRIDYASMNMPHKSLGATDIDGIDFERYFQWEEDGVLSLEIDFASTSRADSVNVEFITPLGKVSSPYVGLNRKGRSVVR